MPGGFGWDLGVVRTVPSVPHRGPSPVLECGRLGIPFFRCVFRSGFKRCHERRSGKAHGGDKIVGNDFEQLEAGSKGASPKDGASNNRSVQGST